jgi:Flp pilus assembly protein TadG
MKFALPLSKKLSKKGSIAVASAVALTTIFGCGAVAVDYARLVLDANQLQKACDAAVMSGAYMLGRTGEASTDVSNARTEALRVLGLNGVTIASSEILFSNNNSQIRVNATTQREMSFAKLIGVDQSNINRHATAQRAAISGTTGVSPLAITTTDYNAYKDGTMFEVTLARNQKEDFNPGNCLACSVDGNPSKPPPVFEEEMKWGCDELVEAGDANVNALNASINQQEDRLDDAVKDDADSRIERAKLAPYFDFGNTYTFPDYPAGDPRVFTVMICEPKLQFNGTSYPTVRGIAPVYLAGVTTGTYTYVDSKGKTKTETVSKLQFRILPYLAFNADSSDIVYSDGSTMDTGLSAIRMVDDLSRSETDH